MKRLIDLIGFDFNNQHKMDKIHNVEISERDVTIKSESCVCSLTTECYQKAKLHEYPCHFCYGIEVDGKESLYRHYPGDSQWHDLFNIINDLRKSTGLEEIRN